MSRINFQDLALSADQARAARNYLGLPQAKAAEESSLPLHKIKRFETGNYVPDADFLTELRAFYEKRGYRFDDTPSPGDSAKRSGQVFPGGVVGDEGEGEPSAKGYAGRKGAAKVHHMRIAAMDEAEMGRILDLIEENEAQVETLARQPVKAGFFNPIAEESQAAHAETLRLMAENGMLFARLFGRTPAGKVAPESLKADPKAPNTEGDLLQNLQADAHLIVTGDSEAVERRKARKPASSVLQALGLS